MFSEASFILSTGGGGRQTPQDKDPSPLDRDAPLVLASSGGHSSGRYASYFNAFLFFVCLGKLWDFYL